MAINGIFGSTNGATGAQNSFSTGRVSIQSSNNNQLSDDAARVKISDSDKSKSQGVESAIRYLAPLQNVVETANSATDRANEVLTKTLDLAKQIAAEVDPTKKSVLSSDGATLLSELDTIASTKTPAGVSVIGQGSISYSVNLDKPNDSKGNSLTINIPDIRISKSDLGLSSVTSSSLEESNEASQESLQQALSTISNIAAALKSTLTQILDTAEANGVSRASQGKVTDKDADALAAKIADAIRNAPGLQDANNLDSTKVLDLIKKTDEDQSKNQTTSSAPVAQPKNKKDDEELNPLLVSSGEVAGVSEETF
jgi:hypothetical protein